MSDQDDERFERAAVRWLARASLSTPTMRLDDLRLGLIAFEAMPYNPPAARQTRPPAAGPMRRYLRALNSGGPPGFFSSATANGVTASAIKTTASGCSVRMASGHL